MEQIEPKEKRLIFYSCVDCAQTWNHVENIRDFKHCELCEACGSINIEVQIDFFEV